MKNFKYIAWDYEANSLIQWDGYLFSDTSVVTNFGNYYNPQDWLPLFQYCGYNDLTDKEVYDGAVVELDEDIGIVLYDVEKLSWIVDFLDCSDYIYLNELLFDNMNGEPILDCKYIKHCTENEFLLKQYFGYEVVEDKYGDKELKRNGD